MRPKKREEVKVCLPIDDDGLNPIAAFLPGGTGARWLPDVMT